MDPRAVSSGPNTSTLTGDDLTDIKTALQNPVIFDGPRALNSDGTYALPADKRGLCGAFIDAIYRPLYTCYKMPSSPGDEDYQKSFDYVDPQFSPCSRSLQGPPGYLFARYDPGLWANTKLSMYNYPVPDVANLATETWQEFTIRRVMCPNVPWLTIRLLENRINSSADWVPGNFTVPGLPDNTFPAGTLRFDYAEVTPRTMPYATVAPGGLLIHTIQSNVPGTQPLQWYDITYKFSCARPGITG